MMVDAKDRKELGLLLESDEGLSSNKFAVKRVCIGGNGMMKPCQAAKSYDTKVIKMEERRVDPSEERSGKLDWRHDN